MATVYGVNSTKHNSPSMANMVEGVEDSGRVIYKHDSYEATAKAQGTEIVLGKVKKGEIILPQSAIAYDALGANSALAVGYTDGTTASPAALLASTATTSAGVSTFAACGDAAAATADLTIYATVSGSGAITGSVDLHLLVATY